MRKLLTIFILLPVFVQAQGIVAKSAGTGGWKGVGTPGYVARTKKPADIVVTPANDTTLYNFTQNSSGNAGSPGNDVLFSDKEGGGTLTTPAALLTSGANSPITLTISIDATANGFKNDNGAGWQTATVGGFPAIDWQQFYYFANGDQSIPVTFTFSGATNGSTYNIDVLTSRNTGSDRTADWTCQGVTKSPNAAGALTTTAISSFTATASGGTVVLTVKSRNTDAITVCNAIRFVKVNNP